MTHQRHRISQNMYADGWLHIEDGLDHADPKLVCFAGSYRRGQPARLAFSHYLDLAHARLLFYDLGRGRPVDLWDTKGTPRGKNGPISRVLRVRTVAVKGDAPATAATAVEWRLRQGPGVVVGRGAVEPDESAPDDAFGTVTIQMPQAQARRVACQVLEYLQARAVYDLLQQRAEELAQALDAHHPTPADLTAELGLTPSVPTKHS